MRICILAAGAAGMICGSCLRDNALAGALKRAGHDVTFLPLYTPVRTDISDASTGKQVFFGGINVYLQHASRLFRHTPRVLDWLLDRRWMLKMAGNRGLNSLPAEHGDLTLSILRGEDGPVVKEIHRLLEFLHADVHPDVVSLPNLMFIGLTATLKEKLKVPVICELTGEDLFLDALDPADQAEGRRLIQKHAKVVDRFVATSASYADSMAKYIGVERSRIDVVYPGLPKEFFDSMPADAPTRMNRPPTVGYLARVCPEKGYGRMIEGFGELRKLPGMADARLNSAGYFSPRDRKWYEQLEKDAARAGLNGSVRYAGEVDQAAKHRFYDGIDVFSVPSVYPESKGIYVLEAWAHGVPVVQPSHGSFPELIRETGAGLLVPPGDAKALAASLHELLIDDPRRHTMGDAGRAAVTAKFTDDHMAAQMLRIYQESQA